MEANLDLHMLKSVSNDIVGSTRITFFAEGVCLSGEAIRPDSLFISLEEDEEKARVQLLDAVEKGARGALWLEGMEIPSSLNSEFPVFLVKNVEEALKDLALSYLDEVEPTIVAIVGCKGASYTSALTAFILEKNFTVAQSPKKISSVIEYSSFILNMARHVTLLISEHDIEQAANLMKFVTPQFTAVTDMTPDYQQGNLSEKDIFQFIINMEKELPVTADLLFDGDNERLKSHEWYVDARGCGYSEGNILQIEKVEKENDQMSLVVKGIHELFKISSTDEEKIKYALFAIALSIQFALEANDISQKLQEF